MGAGPRIDLGPLLPPLAVLGSHWVPYATWGGGGTLGPIGSPLGPIGSPLGPLCNLGGTLGVSLH